MASVVVTRDECSIASTRQRTVGRKRSNRRRGDRYRWDRWDPSGEVWTHGF